MADEPLTLHAKNLLADANERMRFQHDYALARFRTLILINGGAIIGLLTYAGNRLDQASARTLGHAFVWYVIGLAATTVSYLFAYLSQGKFMDDSTLRALLQLGIAADSKDASANAASCRKFGSAFVNIAIVSVLIGLGCFIVGSISAMRALVG